MAGQQIYIEETIRAMKKAISRRDDASESDESITQYTNRGNKLKRNAKYVQQGKLNNPSGPQAYRREVEHAGYTRDIINKNPVRFDEDGDEIEDDDMSENGEINDDDPYSGIVIEDLLGPLTSVASLPKHPSLSVPYTSQAIKELADNAAEMVRRESAALWRMKQMFTKLRGDETWAPCGTFETEDDGMIFAHSQDPTAANTSPGQRVQPPDSYGRDVPATNGGIKFASASAPARNHNSTVDNDAPDQSLVNGTNAEDIGQGESARTRNIASTDESEPFHQGDTRSLQGNHDLPSISPMVNNQNHINPQTMQASQSNGGLDAATVHNAPASLESDVPAGDQELPDAPADDEGEEDATTSSEPLSHRMTTRAQAKAPLSKEPSSSPIGSPEAWIHPIFSVPASALPDKDWGLPGPEADETRKLLLLYVQKQEEVVRGAQSLHNGLLRANRMKENVFEWSKAEGHLGEMSDGEDWYDKEKWGLDADLVKGREEEDDETNLPGKKTRQRRQ